jgi:hypothetical protein
VDTPGVQRGDPENEQIEAIWPVTTSRAALPNA